MYRLVLQLQESKTEQFNCTYDWWLFHQNSLIESGAEATLEFLQRDIEALVPEVAKRAELILVPPSHRVQYRYINVPKQQLRHLNRLAPFLMEPYIGQPIEATHCIVRKEKNGTVAVAAVSHECMLQWQNICDVLQWGARYIIPPQYFVPFEEGKPVAFGNDVMCLSDQQVCYLPTLLRQGDTVYNELTIEETLQMLAQDARWRQLSLLQGEYSPATSISKKFKSWVWVVSLCLVALLFSSWANYDQAHDF